MTTDRRTTPVRATKQIGVPTVHLNGTGGEVLLAQLEEAHRALTATVVALQEAAPNARDYYVDTPTSFTAAVREHQDRMTRVQSVLDEIEALHIAVSDQVEARRRP